MKHVRVLLANGPRLMRELVLATISDHEDIEIVDEVPSEEQLETAVAESSADFLILSLENGSRLSARCAPILQNDPELRILAISPEGNHMTLYWTSLSIQHIQMEASEAGVLKALRGRSVLVVS